MLAVVTAYDTVATVFRKNIAIWREHRTVRGQQIVWEQGQAMLDLMDKRTMQLAASAKSSADFVRKNMRPLKWTGSAKCADLSKLIEDGPGDYVFTETLPENISPAVALLLELLRLIKSATCDVDDPVALDGLAVVKERVTVLVCEYERYFPRSEICRVSHIMLHVVDMVHRWNNVRNFWCFLTERYAHHIIYTHGCNRINTVATVC
jgi:hypothetical protein